MDARTHRLLSDIQAYIEEPPKGLPEELLGNLKELTEQLEAPRYSEESPGEKSAREVAKDSMDPGVFKEYYPEGVSEENEVGV